MIRTTHLDEPRVVQEVKLTARRRTAQPDLGGDHRGSPGPESQEGDDPTTSRIRQQLDPWTVSLGHLESSMAPGAAPSLIHGLRRRYRDSRDGSTWCERPENRRAGRRAPRGHGVEAPLPRWFRMVGTTRKTTEWEARAARVGVTSAMVRLVGTTRKPTAREVVKGPTSDAPRPHRAGPLESPTIVGTTVRRRDDGRRGVAHDATTAEIGVFGGSGFYSLLEDVREVKVDTPYGPPSDSVFLAEVAGRRVAFLPRHGRRHTIPPHKINYRANVWAMRSLGVKAVISPCAAGSLQPSVKPGDFVVCDQFVDRTSGRDRHVLRRPDRHPPVLGRDLRPGPARPRDRHDPRPRHRGPRTRHGRRHRGPALLDQVRIEVVQRRRLGSHQHDPVPGGLAVPRTWDGGRQHQPHHRLRRRRHRGHRGGRREERPRGLPAERGADPGGRARPHRALPGRPRRAGRARRPRVRPAATDTSRRPTTSGCSRLVCDPRRSGSACARSGPSRAGGSTAPVGSTRPATPGIWCWDHFMGRGEPTVPVVEGWTILSMAAAATRAGHGRAVRAQRHEPTSGGRRADGRRPSRSRAAAGSSSASASAAPRGSTRRTASTSRPRPNGWHGSRRRSP